MISNGAILPENKASLSPARLNDETLLNQTNIKSEDGKNGEYIIKSGSNHV
jgi:hypothetical protein